MAGFAAASLSSGIYLAANILPFYDHWHGWPATYMVREVHAPSDLTIFYVPWPLGDPPVVAFRPALLVLNVAIGMALSAFAGVLTTLWVRARKHPFQFSLRALFAFMAATAVLSAVIAFTVGAEGTWVLILLMLRLVYVVPCLAVIVGARWLIRAASGSQHEWRWAGMHMVTWISLLIVGGPCFYFSLLAETDLWPATRENIPGWIYLDSVGWPFPYWAAYDSNADRVSAASEGFPAGLFDPAAMAADALIWLLLSASIAFVVERWCAAQNEQRTSNGNPLQWELRLSSSPAGFLAWKNCWGAGPATGSGF